MTNNTANLLKRPLQRFVCQICTFENVEYHGSKLHRWIGFPVHIEGRHKKKNIRFEPTPVHWTFHYVRSHMEDGERSHAPSLSRRHKVGQHCCGASWCAAHDRFTLICVAAEYAGKDLNITRLKENTSLWNVQKWGYSGTSFQRSPFTFPPLQRSHRKVPLTNHSFSICRFCSSKRLCHVNFTITTRFYTSRSAVI